MCEYCYFTWRLLKTEKHNVKVTLLLNAIERALLQPTNDLLQSSSTKFQVWSLNTEGDTVSCFSIALQVEVQS